MPSAFYNNHSPSRNGSHHRWCTGQGLPFLCKTASALSSPKTLSLKKPHGSSRINWMLSQQTGSQKGKRVELQAIDDLEGSALHPFPLGRRLWREERRGGILILSFFCSLGHQFTHCLLESRILLLQLYLSMNKQKRSQQGTHLAFADQTVIAML